MKCKILLALYKFQSPELLQLPDMKRPQLNCCGLFSTTRLRYSLVFQYLKRFAFIAIPYLYEIQAGWQTIQ